MNLMQLVQDALTAIQTLEPGLAAAARATTALGTIGSTAVTVLQKGKQLITYLITRKKEQTEEQPTVTSKRDVALLIDINRRMLHDVARYLDEQQIDADLIVVTNDPTYSDQIKFLDPDDPGAWSDLVSEFSAAMNSIKRAIGGAQIHIFLSTPLSLAFGLGSMWGTVDEATVYHWEGQTYHPSLKISRRLRQ